MALKILIEGLQDDKELAGWDEVDRLTILRGTDLQSPGYQHICHLRDNFVVNASYGSHICVVLEPIGPSVGELALSLSSPLRLTFIKRVAHHVLVYLLSINFIVYVRSFIQVSGAPSPWNLPH